MFSYILANQLRPSGASLTDARLIADETAKPLELRVQALELTCGALWLILKQKHGYTDEELMQAIHDVDAMDGVVDGKITQAGRVCPHCKRKCLTRNPTICSWCGGSLGPIGTNV
jgi:hypothetical protein